MTSSIKSPRKIKSIARVDQDGNVQILFDDDVRELCDALGGKTTSRRASHVELDNDMKWWINLSPVGGPDSVGPFESRELAIDAEKRSLIRMGLPWPEPGKIEPQPCESSH